MAGWTAKERKVRATHTMWNGVLFQPKSPPKCQVMGEAPGSFQLMFPFPVGPRREIIRSFSKHAAKHKRPLALLLPKQQLPTGSSLVAVCCLTMPLPSVLFISSLILYHSFFSLKCGFLKPDKTIVMENNVVSQRGCKLVKPECKLFSNEYCWYVGNNPE